MTLRPALCVLWWMASIAAHAQVCSGGADGGMDATGNDCNDPSRAIAVTDPVKTSRSDAMAAYRIGDFKRAAVLFQMAADQGDPKSAEILALMHRYGPAVFGAGFVADAKMARYWAGRAADAKTRALAVRAP